MKQTLTKPLNRIILSFIANHNGGCAIKKALFLDRDGVINKNVKNLTKPGQFEIMEGAPKAIKLINDSGYMAIIITNQPIIAKGFCTLEDIDKIHDKMKKELLIYGAHIDAIYICPHHPEKGFEGEVKELKIDCECRKPKPGFMLKAAKDYNIDLANSWVIGDSYLDIAAGQKAGVKTAFLTTGDIPESGHEEEFKEIKPNLVCKNLLEAVETILNSC